MNCVDWFQSVTYCHAQGKRLPTEEEWEWAARGGSAGWVYPWGNVAPDVQVCWSGFETTGRMGVGFPKRTGTCVVGSRRSGDAPGGIHDLAGNVQEWTSSNYDARVDFRVYRGGHWLDDKASHVRAGVRGVGGPLDRDSRLGFRCAM